MKPIDYAKPQEAGAAWLERIRAAEKARGLDRWTKDAEEAEAVYLQDDGVEGAKLYDFNILHSNIETVGPSLYNSTPIPDIRERYRTGPTTPETALARLVGQVIERAVLVQIDDGKLDGEMEGVTQDALLAGRGVIWVKFDADVQEVPPQPVMDPMTGQPAMDPATGEPLTQPVPPVVSNERLIYEVVAWRDYREGPATRWRDVPWVARRHCIAADALDGLRDPDLKEKLGASGTEPPEDNPDSGDVHVWEIWDKERRCVYMVADATGELLRHQDDPLGLSGFFPCAQPVQPITATGKRTPVVPFKVYKRLADELERITKRIARITEGLKVRGFYVGNAADLDGLAKAGDNELIPVADLESMAQTGGLDKAISWWPLDQAIRVLQQLYLARDQAKATIYEVTGISDIVRGASQAQETATAQKIKSEWGSLRVKKLQRLMERCVREVFIISAEIIGSKFSPETLQRMTGLQLPPEAMAMLGRPLDHYRIDVESDSTVRADLTRKRQDMAAFLEGTGQFFGTMAPLVQQSPALAAPIAEIYAAFARQFSLGKQAEDALEKMIAQAQQAAAAAPPQAQPDPEKLAKAKKLEAETMQTNTETVLMGGPLMPGQPIPPQSMVMAGAQGKGPLAQAMKPQPAPGQPGQPPRM